MRVYTATGEGGTEYRCQNLAEVDAHLRAIGQQLAAADRGYPAKIMILEMDRDILLDMRMVMEREMVS